MSDPLSRDVVQKMVDKMIKATSADYLLIDDPRGTMINGAKTPDGRDVLTLQMVKDLMREYMPNPPASPMSQFFTNKMIDEYKPSCRPIIGIQVGLTKPSFPLSDLMIDWSNGPDYTISSEWVPKKPPRNQAKWRRARLRHKRSLKR